MLGSTVGLKAADFEDNSFAVVIGLGRAHDSGDTSTVYCFKLARELGIQLRVCGSPFRLLRASRYIWNNEELRQLSIEQGSLIKIFDQCRRANEYEFLASTGVRMTTGDILSQLSFGDGASRGVCDAFPNANIAMKSIVQDHQKPFPPYALISVVAALTCDDRILAITRLGEELNLNNRSRGDYKVSTISERQLPIQEPTSDNDVGSVILVTFGSMTPDQKFLAICEAILLQESSGSCTAEPLEMTRYPMSRLPRGICLIINNLCFEKRQKHRFGGEYDEEQLRCLFEEDLHFEVHVKHDLANNEMQRVCEEFALKDHSKYDAFVCIIMSHGDKDHIEGVNGKSMALEDLMSDFKPGGCPSLSGKPKVFIIQACRGSLRDEPVLSNSVDSTVASHGTDSTISTSISPQETDFLLAFATAPGYVANRDKDHGSVFIQTLVEVIKEYRETEHLSDMLTIVTRLVVDKQGQVPAPVNTLRYKLYL